jgi:hypothetical protein
MRALDDLEMEEASSKGRWTEVGQVEGENGLIVEMLRRQTAFKRK